MTPEPDSTPCVLLVEDSATDAELTLRTLRRRAACDVHWVQDGVEALSALRAATEGGLTSPPRLVLLDLKMPRLDGHEVLRALKADPATRAIPVVVFTSSREPRDLARAYAEGANSYLVKPVDGAQLDAVLTQLGSYWLRLNEPAPAAGSVR